VIKIPQRILDRLRTGDRIWISTTGETFFTQYIIDSVKRIMLDVLKKVDDLRPGILISKPLPISEFYKYTYTGITKNLGVTEY